MKMEAFDRTDPKNIGRPSYFIIDDFIKLVEQYISTDEVDTALYLIDNMPGWYRDNMPQKVKELKEKLLRQFFTNLDYAKDGCRIEDVINQLPNNLESFLQLERGKLAHQVVSELNNKDILPWIYELGPGSYWLPMMLKEADLTFLYYGPSLNGSMQDDVKEYLKQKSYWREKSVPNQKRVFIAFELIEHLARPEEIYHHCIKAGGDFDVILLSTPKYTYGGGMEYNEFNALGHLRTYTPTEFMLFAMKHWPTHRWSYFDGPVMMLKGEK